MDSVARGTLVNLATRLLGVALVLAITTLVARIGTEAQGAFALFTSVEGVLLALFSGLGLALARQVSQRGAWPRALTGATVLASALLGVLAGLALLALSTWGPPAYRWLWLLALAAPVLLQAPNLQGLWLGAGRMLPMARLALAPPLLALLLVGALALLQRAQLGGVLLAWVLAKVAVGGVLVAWLWRSGRLAAPDLRALRGEAGFIATIGLTNLVALLNYRVGLFVVERLVGLSATGVYSIAVVVAELLWFVSGSLTQAAYGRIGRPQREQAAALTVRVMQLGVAALVPAAPLLWLLAWLLVPRLLGPAYAASLLPLALLLPGVLLFGAAGSLSAWFTHHLGRPQVPGQVAALSLLLNAGLALLLVPRLGSAGAALAASLAYASSVAVLAWRFARSAGLPLSALVKPSGRAPWAALWDGLRSVASPASRRGGRR
ncbi:MAG: teichoic acid transporter [Rubrivivax sp. SCN 71-131]|jgi:O-antigen/teichoic acid export membrane protein|nr:MAG: teichoic acid transporter [Rubrivivax sp. SCN 71-131]